MVAVRDQSHGDRAAQESGGAGEEDRIVLQFMLGRSRVEQCRVVDGSRPRPTPTALGHKATGIVRRVGPHVREVAAGGCPWSSSASAA